MKSKLVSRFVSFCARRGITFCRYVREMRLDASSASIRHVSFFFLSLSFVLLFVLFLFGADLYTPNGGASKRWAEVMFGTLGAIDARPEAARGSIVVSMAVRIVGVFLVCGVLTSCIFALVERFARMRNDGLLTPAMEEHFVVVGYCPMTDDLIRALLDPPPGEDLALWRPQDRADDRADPPRKRRVLLYTGANVDRIRKTLNAVLPEPVSRRIVYAAGSMDLGSKAARANLFRRLRFASARQVYVLGDERPSSVAGDVENLAFATGIADCFEEAGSGKGGRPADRILPIFVRLDGMASFDLVKKTADGGRPGSNPKVCLRPFGFDEGWARQIWGDVVDERVFPSGTPCEGGSSTWSGVLDFEPLERGRFVRLVVVGLTPRGEALVLEALRVCHYPSGEQTLVTIIDPEPAVWDSFLARHPTVRTAVRDIKLDFVGKRLEDPTVRKLLREAATNPNQLLTVAICFHHVDSALSAALNLPEEVYWRRREKKDGPPVAGSVGARVWYYQSHRNRLPDLVRGAEGARALSRYGNLRPFGMQEGGLAPWCLREFDAMYLNAVYDWPNVAPGRCWLDGIESVVGGRAKELIGRFRTAHAERLEWRRKEGGLLVNDVQSIPAEERKNLLLAVLEDGETAIREFQKLAFERYMELDAARRWGNVYVSDAWGGILRALGLRTRRIGRDEAARGLLRENDRLFGERLRLRASEFQRSLEELEHNRWVAERALMGYRAPRPGSGEKRDDEFRIHPDLVPYVGVPPKEKGKDSINILAIPVFLALEGYRIEDAGDARGTRSLAGRRTDVVECMA